MTDGEAQRQALAALFTRLEQATHALLMLDYDGTLAPFRIDPAQAVPYPGVAPRLDAIMDRHDTRVVIVSGRRAAEIAPLLGMQSVPEIWGAHGWECRSPRGNVVMGDLPELALAALVSAAGIADRALRFGARLERKPGSLALHWRGLPGERPEQIRAAVLEGWTALTRSAPVALLDFDGGIELRALGRTKGDVVHLLLDDPAAPDAAAYLGDDRTDEDAFAALQGRGTGILVRAEPRPTAAQAWLRPPEDLLGFLDRWLDARVRAASTRHGAAA
jgi:trehalose-phosphatase